MKFWNWYFRRGDDGYKWTAYCWHHAYLGFGLSTLFGLIGFISLFEGQSYYVIGTWWLISLFWVWVGVDDIVQHIIQREEIKKCGYYRTYSFWHWWPEQVLLWIITRML